MWRVHAGGGRVWPIGARLKAHAQAEIRPSERERKLRMRPLSRAKMKTSLRRRRCFSRSGPAASDWPEVSPDGSVDAPTLENMQITTTRTTVNSALPRL